VTRYKKTIHDKLPIQKKKTRSRNLIVVSLFLRRLILHLFFFITGTFALFPRITGYSFGTFIQSFCEDLFHPYQQIILHVRKELIRYSKIIRRKAHFFSIRKPKRKKKPSTGTTQELVHILPNKIHFSFKQFLVLFICMCCLVFGFGMTGGAMFYWYILRDLPSATDLANRQVPVSTKIYDRNGIPLYTIYKDYNRTPVSLSQIPFQMKLATLAVEDADFYNHSGFSIKGIIRSIRDNWEKGSVSGGSTITQQLVKNALLSPEKTLTRKLKEVTLAILVEQTYTKDQILEMYLNEVPFGGTAYGVQEAAQTFFGKNIEEVTLGEAALLAGLPKSPTQYSPYGSTPERAIVRQRQVLSLMKENGFITESQFENAENEKLVFAQHKTDIKAPHFVAYIRDLLEKTYGKDLVQNGGLSVTTSLDYHIQELAEKTVKDEVEKLGKMHVGNGAAIVEDPKTGEILAMVGSKDYFDIAHGGNVNVTTRLRQPGSSIKVVNYAYALSHGFTPASLLEDTPVTFLTDGQPPYTPKNYENGFRGKISLRSALAESRNIPAVRVLYANGIANMMAMGTQMGITSWTNANNYGLSLTLGGGEVRLLDLARVYATIANYGEKPPINPILEVKNYKGEVIDNKICDEGSIETALHADSGNVSPTPSIGSLQSSNIFSSQVLAASESASVVLPSVHTLNSTCSSTPVLDPRIAFQLTDILKDNSARAPSFGTNSLLVVSKHPEVAVKTGTSNDLRDNLAIGYTKEYVVAVWVGNNDNSPMGRIASGVTGATPIWNKIISPLVADKSTYEWNVPEGMQKVSVCGRKEEWFLIENTPSKFCFEEWANNVLGDHTIKPIIQPHVSITPTPGFKRQVVDMRRVKSNPPGKEKKLH
jgi:membrane carboxypeptidase/penicillin-binding protein